MFCIESLDDKSIQEFLNLVETRSLERIEKLSNFLNIKREEFTKKKAVTGSVFLIRKGIEEAKFELKWCSWVREIKKIEKSGCKHEFSTLFDD